MHHYVCQDALADGMSVIVSDTVFCVQQMQTKLIIKNVQIQSVLHF